MSSCVIWLPPHFGRRVKILFSFVIFAFAGSGCYGVVSLGYGKLEFFFFLNSAYGKSRFVAQLPLAGQVDEGLLPCRVSVSSSICPSIALSGSWRRRRRSRNPPPRSTVPGSFTFNTAAGAREHASTGSQTLQTFHMERHLSACAS